MTNWQGGRKRRVSAWVKIAVGKEKQVRDSMWRSAVFRETRRCDIDLSCTEV